jgi:hypothetical protein
LIKTLEECFSHSLLLYLLLYPCFRKVTSDRSKGATVKIVSLLFYYDYKEYYSHLLFLPCFSCFGQVTSDKPEGAIVKIAVGNILHETLSILSKFYK